MVYGFDHLGRLSVHNNDLHDFLVRWSHILEHMGAKLTSMQMRDVFFRKVQAEPGLETDMAEYEKRDDHHPKKTYEHLVLCVSNLIRRQEQRRNLLEEESLLSNRDNQTYGEKVALAAPDNEDGKGGRKGKNKDESDKPSTPSRTNATFTSNQTPKGAKGGAKGDRGGGKSAQTSEAPTTPNRKAACYYFHTQRAGVISETIVVMIMLH